MSAQPTYGVSAVARRIGVAPATLRTWDRRYGIGPSDHSSGAHRRYTDEDVARLESMRHLVITGVPPAEAARMACEQDEPKERLASVTPIRAGGGKVIATPGAGPSVRGLARAAQTLDTQACVAIMTDYLEREGAERTWDELISPVLVAVGDRWESAAEGIEVEHALSSAVHSALAVHASRLPHPAYARSVLLASAPHEQHSLPLAALAATLAESGVPSRNLGPRVPQDSLVQAVRRTGPAAVFVWSQMPDTGDYSVLEALPSFRPRVQAIVGGPGWAAEAPPGIVRVASLGEAVDAVARALGE